jgi:hypothetical protein
MNAFGELDLHGRVFDDGSQYVCSSLLPNPLLPVSNVHFVLSIERFAAPLNSSHHCVVQLTEPVAPVVPHCALPRAGDISPNAKADSIHPQYKRRNLRNRM